MDDRSDRSQSTRANEDELADPGQNLKQMQFELGKRFKRQEWAFDKDHVFFEPKPSDQCEEGTLEGCIANSCRIEVMSDRNNLYACEHCNATTKNSRCPALKRYILTSPPPKNLIINLKRFQHAAYGLSKNAKKIKYPLVLTLDDFMIHKLDANDVDAVELFESAQSGQDWKPIHRYELYGIVSHSGSMGGGHYVAYSHQRYKGKDYWFFMSDNFVEPVEETKALAAEAYILFY